MTRNEKEMMSSIFAKIAELDYIKPDEIPNIDQYWLSAPFSVAATARECH